MRALRRGLRQMHASMTGKTWRYYLAEFKDDVLGVIWDSWYRPLREVCRAVKRIFIWLPVLYKDRDWDYGFFLEIMRFKLSRMRHNHETKQIIEAWQEVANEIKEAEVIIGRLIEWDSPEAFNADLQLLSDHLKKHLQGWWD